MGWLRRSCCHSNETWHALNSTFPDTNCIVSFHLTNLSNLTKRVPVSPGTMLLHTSLWLQMAAVAWLWLWTGWSLSKFSWFGTIWPFFCSPTWKNTWPGSSIGPMMRSYLQLRSFFWGWKLLYPRNSSAATPMEEVCGPHGRLCKKIHHIWSNSTIAS